MKRIAKKVAKSIVSVSSSSVIGSKVKFEVDRRVRDYKKKLSFLALELGFFVLGFNFFLLGISELLARRFPVEYVFMCVGLLFIVVGLLFRRSKK